jgi:hypothetical protein
MHADRNERTCRVTSQQNVDLPRGLFDRLERLIRFVRGNGVDRDLSLGYGRNRILIQAFSGFFLSLLSLFLDARPGLLFGVLTLFVEIGRVLGLALGRRFGRRVGRGCLVRALRTRA